MYETFYNLTAKPFRLTPDPSFLYISRVHKRALAYLRYGLSQGEGFVVVTGHVGAGKTTLLRTLVSELGDDVVAAEMVATPMAARDVIEHIGASLGITYDGLHRTAVLKRVEAFLKSRIDEGLRVVLLVDECQNLSGDALEELRMLASLEHKGKPYFQVFLIGQDEFKHTIQAEGMEQFRQRVIASFHLKAMEVKDTAGYVLHRLRKVGWNGDPEFTRESLEEIHSYSVGIPRRINTLCDRLLLFGFLEERHVIDSDAVRLVSDELLEELKAQGLAAAVVPEPAEAPAPKAVAEMVVVPEGLPAQLTALGHSLEALMSSIAGQTQMAERIAALEQRLDSLEKSKQIARKINNKN